MIEVRSSIGMSSAHAIKGKNGKSTYEYAKEGGYTGSEDNFTRLMSYDTEKAANNLINQIINKVEQSDLENEVENQLDGAKVDIVQQVINALKGSPLFGTVSDDNVITLTHMLNDGIYRLVYENENGILETICEFTVGDAEDEPALTKFLFLLIQTENHT